jgi:hypothetical protein
MIIKRTLKDGKLELKSELIGGPSDGIFCSNNCERVYIPVREDPVCLLHDGSDPGPFPEIRFHVYKRISFEKLLHESLFL